MTASREREQELRQAILAKPFVPFTVVMTDGKRYDIEQQFSCAYAGDLVVIRQPGGLVRPRLHKVAAIRTRQPVGGE